MGEKRPRRHQGQWKRRAEGAPGTDQKSRNLYFKRIDVSSVIIKAYIYDMLLVKGTPKQMKKAIDSGDLQKVVSKLFDSGYKRGTISLGDHNYISFSPGY